MADAEMTDATFAEFIADLVEAGDVGGGTSMPQRNS